MHKLFSGKEHGFVPFFFFFYKGSVFSHSMATELLNSASLKSSPGLLSKPFFFFFTIAFLENHFLLKSRPYLNILSFTQLKCMRYE